MTKYTLEVIFLKKINFEPLQMETWNPQKERGFKFPHLFKFLFQISQTKYMEKELHSLSPYQTPAEKAEMGFS